MHEGHRQRMLSRILSGDGKLQDHELLEILLYGAVARKNTNEIAHRLLDEFDSLEGVLSAATYQLTSVEGVGERTAAYLKSIGLCFERIKEQSIVFPNMSSLSKYSDFIIGRFRGLNVEKIEAYALDGFGNVIAHHFVSSKAVNSVEMSSEELFRFIVGSKAKGAIVAHNHPKGRALPSAQDDKFTRSMIILCSYNSVKFYDHVIVAGDELFSYRLNGHLASLQERILGTSVIDSEVSRW